MKYAVHFNVYASQVVEVEADNEEEAKEKAIDKFEPVCLCHQCSDLVDIGDDGEIVEVTNLDE